MQTKDLDFELQIKAISIEDALKKASQVQSETIQDYFELPKTKSDLLEACQEQYRILAYIAYDYIEKALTDAADIINLMKKSGIEERQTTKTNKQEN